MGCWNATCAISGLPIECGSEVYAAIVAIEQEPLNRCGATSVAFPIAPMFEGTYNDYGGVEADASEADIALGIANQCLKSTLDLAAMMETLVRGEAKYLRFGQYSTRLGIWIAHKPIVDALGRRDQLVHTYESGRQLRITVDHAISAARLAAEDFSALLAADDIRAIAQFWREMAHTSSPYLQRQHLTYLARQADGDVNTRYWITNLVNQVQDLHAAAGAKTSTTPDVRHAFEQLARTLHMTRAMEILRRCWLPATGEGSQGTDYDEHAHLATLTAQVAQTLRDRDVD